MFSIDSTLRRKVHASAGAVALALATTASAMAAEVGVTDTTIKIGMYGPLTGATSVYGYPINNGAIALYKEINDQGGINGRKIEIVHEDDGCDPAKARAAVKKLIFSDKVFMIHGGSCSAAVVATREDIVEAKVPFMVMAATLDAISAPPTKHVFTTALPSSGDGQVIVNFAQSIPGAKKFAVVRHANEWADAKWKKIEETYKAAGLELVADAQLDAKATDATPAVLKIKSASPDVTMFLLYPGESAVFLRDAEKYGLKGPFLGTSSVQDVLDLADRAGSKNAVKDVYVVSFLKGPVGSTELAKYTDIYKKQFPRDKLQSLSFYGMSGAITIINALRAAGKDLTRDKFVAALEATKNGDAGPAFCEVTFGPNRRQGCLTGTMWTLRDGQIVNIGATFPTRKP